ncbi:DUF262 domain-containing protein [Arenibacter sp. TNZ]|uniref:DUF262 domain-containing protein n=1 Tax=Arenibacter TaxID=178469 RepID=UPI000CD46B87|nr:MULTISPECIES: DUF262 domain-containing protein [Arenibacter]MCM4171842.1 DUF262 domain-containing protein [Arenibacter sp. TNZ]
MGEIGVNSRIINVQDLLVTEQLALPVYQRPYKWSTTNVSQLLEDICHFSKKKAYRLGTIVIHEDIKKSKTIKNIVDGQQRTVSLILITKAILGNRENYQNPVLRKKLEFIASKLISFNFTNSISKYNVKQNYREIQRIVARLTEEEIFFLFDKCEMVQFILSDITEAFQFFDAQNARGRDLDPHDLLKAFHLREFSMSDIALQNEIVEQWENTRSKELATLFSEYLYRIKGWVKGNSARYFDKDDIPLFKGLHLDETKSFPYTVPLRIAHYFTDDYNHHIDRKIDNIKREFPFQLDQTIINGRRFFEFVNYYKNIIDTLYSQGYKGLPLDDTTKKIFNCIQTYSSRHRIGDQYTRALFDCALLFYIDKFQYENISRATEKLFVWAYSIRLNYQNLGFASIDNYVVNEINIFKEISQAITPDPIINLSIKNIDQIKGSNIPELIHLFKEFKYHE